MSDKIKDVDGNEVGTVKFSAADYKQYGKLLLRALFPDLFKDNVPEEKQEEMREYIEALCFLRGVYEFDKDVQSAKGDISSVVRGHAGAIAKRIQTATNSLYRSEKEGKEIKPNDAAVFDFVKSKGVAHMPDPLDIDMERLQDSVKQVAMALGMSEEEFARLEKLVEEESTPTPGCDCPGCRKKRDE